MKKATRCAIVGVGLILGLSIVQLLLSFVQEAVFRGGSPEEIAILQTVYKVLGAATVAGWGLLLYFFIALYKKQ